MNMKFILLLLLIFSLANAAVLKWPEDCIKTEKNPNPPHKSLCYHQVAMSYALVGNKEEAIDYCHKIAGTGEGLSSLIYTEEGQMSRCFIDVAVIFGEESICNEIAEKADYEKGLCKTEVEAANKKNENMKKVCEIAYVLPFILISSFFFRRIVH